jgi:hypothetical protein
MFFPIGIYAISDLDSKYVFWIWVWPKIMEYKTNQISGLRLKKKDADEAAIIENYKPFSKNKITVKEPNSTKPCIKC